MQRFWNWGAGDDRIALEDGSYLRLLTAMEVLEAGREARSLQQEDREEGLCANACLLARAWERGKTPIYSCGEEVLENLPVSRIQALAKTWAEWDRAVNPGLTLPNQEGNDLKKDWSTRRKSACVGGCSGRLGRFLRNRGRGR